MMVNYYGLLVVALTTIISYNCESGNSYVVLFPKVMSGGEYTVGVTYMQQSMSGATVTGSVRVIDMSDKTDALFMNYVLPPANCNVIPCSVSDRITLGIGPQMTAKSYRVEVSGSGDNGAFNVSSNIRMNFKSAFHLFVQTDKALYKPSQTVKFRVLSLKPDLIPFPTLLNVFILDPRGNRIKQMLNVESADAVITGEMELSDEPITGDYTINAIGKDGDKNVEVKKTFEVAEYVLPTFEVTVKPPSYLLADTTEPTITVTVKYTYGKPVKGECDLHISRNKYYWEKDEPNQILINAKLIDGKASYNKVRLVNSNSKLTTGREYKFSATCTEDLTGKSVTKNESVMVSYRKFSLKFLERTPSNYKPGMDFQAYVKLSLPDGSPPTAADLAYLSTDGLTNKQQMELLVQSHTYQYHHYPYSTTKTHKTMSMDVDPSGIVLFEFPINSTWASGDLHLLARFNISQYNSVTSTQSISQFYSRDRDSVVVSLTGTEAVLKVNQVARFKITTSYYSSTFHLLFFSSGKIASMDKITRAASTEHIYDISLNKDFAHRLSPKARLVVWTRTSTNEILADSIDFNVNAALNNQVEVSFSPINNQPLPAIGEPVTVAPGASVNIKVTAEANSYFALTVVDLSAKLLGNSDLNEDEIVGVLDVDNTFSGCGGGYYPYYPMPDPMPPMGPVDWRVKRSSFYYFMPPFTSCGGSNTLEVIQNAGFYLRTDLYLHEEILTTTTPIWYPQATIPGGTATFPMTTIPPWTTTFLATTNIPGQPGQPGQPDDRDTSAAMPEKPLLEATRVRSLFPETWLWEDGHVGGGNGGSGEFQKVVVVPDSITSWVASAFATHENKGVGLSTPGGSQLRVFKPFFVNVELPYSIVRGEEFELKIVVQNYLSTDLPVKVTLEKSADFKVSGPAGDDYLHAKMYTDILVTAGDGYTVSVWLKPVTLGSITIDVMAQSSMAADRIQKPILVEAEGAPQEDNYNVLISLTQGTEYSEDVTLQLPPNVVAGSVKIQATAIGDIMGPAMNNIGSLLRMPYGCGEQNMLNFAPNIFIINYLKATGLQDQDTFDKAKKFTIAGYQRQLKYQRLSGCFSAFGQRDTKGDSTWLTAFVLKSFGQARSIVDIIPEHITSGLSCLIKKQEVSGLYREDGYVRHKAMQGGSGSGVRLSAYVAIALLELKDVPMDSKLKEKYDESLRMVLNYLNGQVQINSELQKDPYMIAILGYALALDGSSSAYNILDTLQDLAKYEDGQIYWEEKRAPTVVPPIGIIPRRWMPPYKQASSVNVEIASYALMMFVKLHKELEGLGIMKMIVSQRNANGGFKSTQDTVLALQALGELGAKIYSDLRPSMNVEIRSSTIFRIFPQRIYAPDTQLLLQILELDELPEQPETVLTVTGRGRGTALVQITVKYNINTLGDDTGIKMNVTSKQIKDGLVQVDVCASYRREGTSGMVLYEVKPLSGFTFSNLEPLRDVVSGLKRTEQNKERAVLYLDQVDQNGLCVPVVQERQNLVANMERARAIAYAYYDTADADSGFYLPTALQSQSPQNVCPSCTSNAASNLHFVVNDDVITASATEPVPMITLTMTVIFLTTYSCISTQ